MDGSSVTDANNWPCVFARAITSAEIIAAACANLCDMFNTPLDVILSS